MLPFFLVIFLRVFSKLLGIVVELKNREIWHRNSTLQLFERVLKFIAKSYRGAARSGGV